jgi:hypothetical protein
MKEFELEQKIWTLPEDTRVSFLTTGDGQSAESIFTLKELRALLIRVKWTSPLEMREQPKFRKPKPVL